MSSKAVNILGVRVDNLSLSEALLRAEDLLESGGAHYIVTPNPEIVLRAYRDSRLREILNNASMSLCDGMGVFLAGMLNGKRFTQRITGVDFMDALCHRAAEKKWRVAFVGASSDVRENLCAHYQQMHPASFFQSLADEMMNKPVDADIIFVALGAPKQEEWMVVRQKSFDARGVMVGVGGAFDILAGSLPRAPQSMRSLGLEWLWRIFLQPWRIKRVVNAVIVFPIVYSINILKNL
ncbi:MAG: WecB/TagA/CpsF family glycosyltransferase [Candidatus Spechtbacteria bacterium]|nr:WecB/TagA/CpsF family glycosyltransferase [Candidatus Spechtbacteria bacterium]